MRNKDGTFAGAGTHWAYKEDEDESHKSDKVHVNLPYDYMTKEERASLNGKVKTYHIKELKR